MKRALIFCLIACAAVSCDRERDDSARPVRLGYFANLTHAQAVLGIASGDFARAVAPRALQTQVFNAGPSLIEALLAGEIDVAYVGPGPALTACARTHGMGIRVIAGAAANGVVIVARDGSGIQKPEDLKGRKLATPQHGNTQDISARHYLIDVLKQSDASNIVPIANAEQVGMMSRGQIDAAWAPEPWGSLLAAQGGGRIIGQEKDLWPGGEFTLTVVVTTPEFLQRRPDVIERILRVHRLWTRRLREDPNGRLPQLGDALFSLTGKRIPAGVMHDAMAHVKFTDDASVTTFDSLADWSYELGFERQPVDLTPLMDLTILHRLESAHDDRVAADR